MQINADLLITWGAVARKFKKGEFIFHEGDHPRFYYQILEGTVKMFNTNLEGKEFTQMEFKSGHSFGEPPLFIDESYPSTAVVCTDSIILKLSKEKFLEILDQYPAFQKQLITLFAKRIYSKSITAREIINNTPETRIMGFLNDFKKKSSRENEKIEIPYTRQEIANYTGLRVETVIRTLTKMKTKKIVQIVDRKLIY
ncbi:MAG: Crp/Fnr family transcriptional regulator [Sphingobacteriaceae bacterium]|nr:Crp/Fnr family transcriptional regulator [Sphingobacteriaceae bacterium]MBP8032944.1 Crp/Fnr family transcriptional regulator [Bacteroidia bacterium]